MKKLLTVAIAIMIAGVTAGSIFYACKKEENSNVTQSEQELSRKITITIYWEKWGRAAKNCDGSGLCRFSITIKKSAGMETEKSANLYYVGDDLYADILIDDDYTFDEDGTSLYIDEDLYAADGNGRTYIISQGQYPLDTTLGRLGGYTIPVFVRK